MDHSEEGLPIECECSPHDVFVLPYLALLFIFPSIGRVQGMRTLVHGGSADPTLSQMTI